jgi:cellulose synthase/poly-beta-1,6-N-acetylglucosamine synthase-like glycosyltransferase
MATMTICLAPYLQTASQNCVCDFSPYLLISLWRFILTKFVDNKKHPGFKSSIGIPVTSLLIVMLTIMTLVIGFWCLHVSQKAAYDISILYYLNIALVYGLWVGLIILYMFYSFRKKESHPGAPPKTRFLCLIPSYNEETVIQNSVSTLLNQKYPKSLFDVVVVFDGIDKTAEKAKQLGAKVLKTPSPASGKHKALLYAIEKLVSKDDACFVVVFDADNIVTEVFLQRMNDAITAKGFQCVQGYHGVSNKASNWVTKALWCSTTASSRLYNQGRYNSIRNSLICGTGWGCKGSLLKELWGSIKTQTEDIELNGLLLLKKGVRVAWVPEARFYDEKPLSLWVAIKQRRRWMTGHMRVFLWLAWPCLKAAFQRRDLALLEISLYYAVPFVLSVSIIQLFVVLTGVTYGVFSVSGPLSSSAAQLFLAIITLFFILVYQFIGFGIEYRLWLKSARYSFYTIVFSFIVWTFALVWSWFSLSRSDWMSHTPHVSQVRELKPSFSKT